MVPWNFIYLFTAFRLVGDQGKTGAVGHMNGVLYHGHGRLVALRTPLFVMINLWDPL